MRKNSRWVPRIANLVRLATSLTSSLRTISLEAKSSSDSCVSSLFQIGSLIEEYHSNGDANGFILDLFASVSRKPISKCLLPSRSALEWIVDYSWSLLHIVGDNWKLYLYTKQERNDEVRIILIDYWADILKHATRDIAGWGGNGAPKYIRRKLPTFHEILELETEMNWECSHLFAELSVTLERNVFRSDLSENRQPNAGGRKPLSAVNPLKVSLYQQILRLAKVHSKPQNLLEAIKDDNEVRELGLKLNVKINRNLIQAANSWQQRDKAPKTKRNQR